MIFYYLLKKEWVNSIYRYQYEKFIKAFYTKEEIKYNGEMVQVIGFSKLNKNKSWIELSNGKTVRSSSNLKHLEDIEYNWENVGQYTFSSDKDKIKKYEFDTKTLVGLIMDLILFIESYKKVLDADKVAILMENIADTFEKIKKDKRDG